MAIADHSHPEAATKTEFSDKFGELKDEFWSLKAEVAELRGRVDLLTWVVGMGFVALIAMSAVFRYVG